MEIEISNFFILLENKNADHGAEKGRVLYEDSTC